MKKYARKALWLVCCLAMVLSVLTPLGMVSAEGVTASITGAEQTPYVKAAGQESKITLSVDMAGTYYLKATAAANTPAAGAAYPNPSDVTVDPVVTALELAAGDNTVTALTPDTNALLGPGNTATLILTLYADEDCTGEVLASYTDEAWARTRHWEIYLSESAHFDMGYTAYQENLRSSFTSITAEAINYVQASREREETENYKYVFGSAWGFGSAYALKSNAEEIDVLLDLVNSGDMAVGADWFNYTMENFNTEENARATYYTNRYLVDRYGIPTGTVAREFDNPSFSKAYVDAAVSAGIKYGIHSMNTGRSPYYQQRQYDLFYMQGNNPENKMLILNGRHYAITYGMGGTNVDTAYNEMMTLIGELEALEGRRTFYYDKYALQIVGGGGDNGNPTGNEGKMADGINKKMADSGYIYPRVKAAFPEEFFEDVEEEYANLIPVETGTEENWWNDGWGTSAYESGINKQAGAELPVAETAASLASLTTGAEYPVEDLSTAWGRNLTYDEHTWGAASWLNSVSAYEQQWEWKRTNAFAAKALADTVLEDALNALASDVVSGSGKSIYVYNDLNWSRSDVVTLDAEDLPTYFVIKDGDTSVPYTVKDGTVTFVANNVPALGFKLFTVEAVEAAPTFSTTVITGDNYIENAYYKVTFAADGTISSILDKTNGNRELVDQNPADGEKFNQYRYYEDNAGRDGTPVVLNMYTPDVDDSLLSITSDGVKATATLHTSTFRASTITQTVTLYNNIPRIDIVNEVVKGSNGNVGWSIRNREEAFYTFPFAIDGDYQIRYDLPVGNLAEGDQIYGTSHSWYTFAKWTGVRDLSNGYNIVLASPNTSLMQFGERRTGDWDFDYISENPYLYSYVFNNQWFTNFQNDQPGYSDFRYSISTNTNGADMSANNRFGWEISTPLQAVVTDGAATSNAGTYLGISASNVQVSTLKSAEANGEGMILRVIEAEGKDTASVTVILPYNATITETDIIENDLTDGVKATGSSFTFSVPAYGYKTFRIVRTDAAKPAQVTGVSVRTASEEGKTNLILSSTAEASRVYDYRFVADNAKEIDSSNKDWAGRGGDTVIEWIEFTWDDPQTIGQLVIANRNNQYCALEKAVATFSDGTEMELPTLPNNGTSVQIPLDTPITTTSVKITLYPTTGSMNLGLNGVEAYAPGEGSSVLPGTAVTWNAAENALYYRVYRGTTADFVPGSGNYVGSTTGTSLYDSQVVEGLEKTYYYKVVAIGAGQDGEPSQAAQQTFATVSDSTAPSAPVLSAVVRTEQRIDLYWTPSTDNLQLSYYEIYRDGELLSRTTDNYLSSYRDKAAEKGVTYTYQVVAVDVAGLKTESNLVSATTYDNSATQLTSLSLKQEAGNTVPMQQAFQPDTFAYTVGGGMYYELLKPICVTATAPEGSTITVNGKPLASGATSDPIEVTGKDARIVIRVSNGELTRSYTISFNSDDSILKVASATAGSTYNATRQPITHTIDNSGMSGTSSMSDTHTNTSDATTMWHTAVNPAAPDVTWAQYDFGTVCTLTDMYVWNHNQINGSNDFTDRGLKNVKIEYSLTGEDDSWTELAAPESIEYLSGESPEGYPFQFARATGSTTEPASNLNDGKHTPISFNGVEARYVRLTARDNYGGNVFGLAEVRFSCEPLQYYPLTAVTEIVVSGADGADAITVNGGTLQMVAEVNPVDASCRDVTWSVTDEEGNPSDLAIISETGLLQARKNGTVKVVAAAQDESGVTGEKTIVISGQRIVWENVSVTAGSTYDEKRSENNIVNNSGMSGVGSVSDTHVDYHGGTDTPSIWHTLVNPGENAWLEFDLGEVIDLGEIWVWNINTPENERGLRNVKVEYKTSAEEEWTELRGVNMSDANNAYPYTLECANGLPGLKATNLVGGEPIIVNQQARYVRITADPNPRNGTYYDDTQTTSYYYGLSEVRFTVAEKAPEHVHTLTAHEAKAATCTEDGNIEYWECTECHKLFSDANATTEITLADTVIKAEGHSFSDEWKYDGTNHWHECTCGAKCDEAAHTWVLNTETSTDVQMNYSCLCGATKTETGSHTIISHAAKAATCTEDGNIEYWECTECHKLFSDADATTEITLADTVIKAEGHSFGEAWTHNETHHWHECAACGEKKDEAAHQWTLTGETATTKTYTCECGRTKTESVVTPPNPGDGGSQVLYTISVTQTAGGRISPASASAKEGADVTFTIQPDEGYRIADVLVDGVSVGAVSTYTFRNVSSRHYITAVFEKLTGSLPFVDVPTDSWFRGAVEYVYENGIMTGVESNRFDPNGSVSRAMVWTVLARMEGENTNGGDTWYAKARTWAMTNGVSDGTDPMGSVTREQLAAMLYRYSGSPVVSGSLSTYPDGTSVSSWAKEAMIWATQTGLITGTGDGTLAPQAGATRSQLATILMRFCTEVR